jgi:hypothetical protein
VEIAGVTLPSDYIDSETGRCCVLMGHLGDPDIPCGFNVTVPHQHQWILQSVLFIPCRLLTFEQCQQIRKEGSDARRKLAEGFVKSRMFHMCDVPVGAWKESKDSKAKDPKEAKDSTAKDSKAKDPKEVTDLQSKSSTSGGVSSNPHQHGVTVSVKK